MPESLALDCRLPQYLNIDYSNTINLEGPEGKAPAPIPQLHSTIRQLLANADGSKRISTQTDSLTSAQTHAPFEEPLNLIGDPRLQCHPELPYQPDITGQSSFPQPQLNEWIKQRANPHLTWPLDPSYIRLLDFLPSYISDDYGIDMDSPPAELFSDLKARLHIQGTDIPYPDTIPNSISSQAAFPPLPNLNRATYLSAALESPPGSVTSTSSFARSRTNASPTTASSISLSHINEPNRNRYTLMVARKTPVPGSTEVPGPKKLDFDSYEMFKLCFEPWLSATFTDPIFSWETMEFLGADPEISSRLSDADQVLMDIQMYHIRYRTTNATLILVSKDKGK
ncbi:hypothetical protein TWF718_010925 [Orbilia javanica]|uniref:Uncharacterized protein n=1 Tax=Orbilia javanica TaxID=47235 RepID=A0AAN8MR28_9PEZI